MSVIMRDRAAASASATATACAGLRAPPSQLQPWAKKAVVTPFAAASRSALAKPEISGKLAVGRGAMWRSKLSPCRSMMPGST